MLVQEIKLLTSQVEDAGVKVQIDWTPGHATIEGDKQADRLAKDAALEAETMEKRRLTTSVSGWYQEGGKKVGRVQVAKKMGPVRER